MFSIFISTIHTDEVIWPDRFLKGLYPGIESSLIVHFPLGEFSSKTRRNIFLMEGYVIIVRCFFVVI